jgi:hypothetical protein
MKITGSGLLAIACAVALLWTCLIGEHVMFERARQERALVMRGLDAQRNGRHAQPVSTPAFPHPRTPRPAAG